MTWAWAFAAAVLVMLVVVPVMARQVTTRHGDMGTARDEASSQMGRLESALDAAAPDADGRAEAEQCLRAARATRGMWEEAVDYRRAASLAGEGLAALGVVTTPGPGSRAPGD